MNRTILAIVVVLAVLGALYFWQQPPQQTRTPAPEPARSIQEAEPPAPQYPVPEPPSALDADVGGGMESPPGDAPEPGPEPAPPLPALGESDPLASQALQTMFAAGDALGLFNIDGFIRRLVVTVDNLPRTRFSLKQLAVQTAPERFLVRAGAGEDEYFIRPENYRRYVPHVRLLESLDTAAFTGLYIRYYPLFQAAYEELGYPDAYFNDRLVEVIDHLLATPEVSDPVRLTRPHVLYQYADPELESLSAGQKTLIRMGADNARRVKAKLREIRARLTRLEID
ncbi:MAG: hypothetical protein CMN57_07835 [Gammaproteobacteria bacterium]|nr:hypothetical protein [Gammaproteobacteria bacterium]